MSTDLFRQNIIDHFKHPRHFGVLKKPTHEAGLKNMSCGDAIQIQAVIKSGKIADIAFTGTGCAISMAAASMLVEHALGTSFASIQKMSIKDIEKLLKTPISAGREKCAIMGLETLKQLHKV
jgi:nitrogen fixation protein NifU and related proteins